MCTNGVFLVYPLELIHIELHLYQCINGVFLVLTTDMSRAITVGEFCLIVDFCWWVPETGVPPVIIHFNGLFIMNQPLFYVYIYTVYIYCILYL